MSDFKVSVRENPGMAVVRLEGEGGYLMVDQIDAFFRRVLAARPSLVILDLEALEFAASLFLGAIIRFRKDVVRGGGKVQVAGAQPKIMQLFEITQIAQFFEFIPALPGTAC